MSAGTPEDEGFLSRWSRRKRELATIAPKSGAAVSDPLPPSCGGEGLGMGGSAAWQGDEGQNSGFPTPHPNPPHRKRGEGEEAAGSPTPEPEMVEPPSLDLIDKDFNVAHWLKQNVPETWKLAAMRRAWESDPAIAGFENPARDYALDWNTPGGAPGYGPLTESDDVAEMVRGIFGEAPEPETPAIAADEAVSDGMPHQLSSNEKDMGSDVAAQESAESREGAVAVRLSSDVASPANAAAVVPEVSPPVYAAVQNTPGQKGASARIRKRGGGAIPN